MFKKVVKRLKAAMPNSRASNAADLRPEMPPQNVTHQVGRSQKRFSRSEESSESDELPYTSPSLSLLQNSKGYENGEEKEADLSDSSHVPWLHKLPVDQGLEFADENATYRDQADLTLVANKTRPRSDAGTRKRSGKTPCLNQDLDFEDENATYRDHADLTVVPIQTLPPSGAGTRKRSGKPPCLNKDLEFADENATYRDHADLTLVPNKTRPGSTLDNQKRHASGAEKIVNNYCQSSDSESEMELDEESAKLFGINQSLLDQANTSDDDSADGSDGREPSDGGSTVDYSGPPSPLPRVSPPSAKSGIDDIYPLATPVKTIKNTHLSAAVAKDAHESKAVAETMSSSKRQYNFNKRKRRRQQPGPAELLNKVWRIYLRCHVFVFRARFIRCATYNQSTCFATYKQPFCNIKSTSGFLRFLFLSHISFPYKEQTLAMKRALKTTYGNVCPISSFFEVACYPILGSTTKYGRFVVQQSCLGNPKLLHNKVGSRICKLLCQFKCYQEAFSKRKQYCCAVPSFVLQLSVVEVPASHDPCFVLHPSANIFFFYIACHPKICSTAKYGRFVVQQNCLENPMLSHNKVG